MLSESVKDRIILILGILCLIFFFWAIGTTRGFFKQKKLAQEEIRARLEVEEENINLSKERSLLSAKSRQLSLDLQKQSSQYQQAKELLEKAEKDNRRLQDDLERLTRLKQALEENLKDALMKNPKPAVTPQESVPAQTQEQ